MIEEKKIIFYIDDAKKVDILNATILAFLKNKLSSYKQKLDR